MIDRAKIAFGPSSHVPSWEWVGVRMARLLQGSFDVMFFDDFATMPDASIIVIVKNQPPRAFVEAALSRQIRLVYLPIDRYPSAEAIEVDAWFLGACGLVLSHSTALLPYLKPHARRVGLIEHESIYALDALADFKPDGFVLWIGACEHLPHIIGWLQHHDVGAEVKLVTNYRNKSARMEAHMCAHRMGIKLEFGDETINGHEAVLWTKESQARLMRECKAAIDIKGADFNQATKPPTKAQQFLASGIPFACNSGSSVADYLKWRGFAVADAEDPERLFSRGYWQETQAFAPKLRAWTSASAIGRNFEDALKGLLDPMQYLEA